MRIYIVQKGDTLQKIAAEHNVGIDTLMQLNSHISSEEFIVPGLKIKIPKSSLELKQKKELKRDLDEHSIQFSNSKRPLGEVETYNDEVENKDESQHKPNVEKLASERSFAEMKQVKVEHQSNVEPRNIKADYKNRKYMPPKFENDPTVNRHPYYEYERSSEQSLNKRKQPMHPAYYHAPFNHYCPICAYHWQMHLAYFSPFEHRNRRR